MEVKYMQDGQTSVNVFIASVLFVILGLGAMIIVPVFASAQERTEPADRTVSVQPKKPAGVLGRSVISVRNFFANAFTLNNERQASLFVDQAKVRTQEAAWLEVYGTSERDNKRKDKLIKEAERLQDRASKQIDRATDKGRDVAVAARDLAESEKTLDAVKNPKITTPPPEAPPSKEDQPAILFALPTFNFPAINLFDLQAAIESVEQDERAHPDMKAYLGSVKTRVKSRIDKGETTIERGESKKPVETGGDDGR